MLEFHKLGFSYLDLSHGLDLPVVRSRPVKFVISHGMLAGINL